MGQETQIFSHLEIFWSGWEVITMSNTQNSGGGVIGGMARNGATIVTSISDMMIYLAIAMVTWVFFITFTYYCFGPTSGWYVPGVVNFAKGMSVIMTFLFSIALLMVYMAAMVGIMGLRRVFSVVGYVPNFLVSLLGDGQTLPPTITDAYITDFKKMIGDKLAWAGVYCGLVGLLPLEGVPWSPMVIFAMMVFLAFQQAGWREKPPVVARWMAYFLLTSIVSWVIAHALYRFMKTDTDPLNNSFVTLVDSMGDAAKNGMHKASLWITDTMGTENHKAKLTEVVAVSNGPSKEGEKILQLIVERENAVSMGGDTSMVDLAIGITCPEVSSDDCHISSIARTCSKYCNK